MKFIFEKIDLNKNKYISLLSSFKLHIIRMSERRMLILKAKIKQKVTTLIFFSSELYFTIIYM